MHNELSSNVAEICYFLTMEKKLQEFVHWEELAAVAIDKDNCSSVDS